MPHIPLTTTLYVPASAALTLANTRLVGGLAGQGVASLIPLVAEAGTVALTLKVALVPGNS